MIHKYHLCKSEKEEVQEQNPGVLHIRSPPYLIYNFLHECQVQGPIWIRGFACLQNFRNELAKFVIF
jgi:hypothetical protein